MAPRRRVRGEEGDGDGGGSFDVTLRQGVEQVEQGGGSLDVTDLEQSGPST